MSHYLLSLHLVVDKYHGLGGGFRGVGGAVTLEVSGWVEEQGKEGVEGS